ncbi:hypothetical protein JXA27_06530 [Aerococcaceae bacterium zg-B36]|uniref:hypothetical protein n=1 Tax=Aerococcaceae bacterium zg-252 TaxID=2796928 RepID=UPI001BD81700|nr:hypothetical protein [Aerococcaceae bacterium zg-B36]
MKKKLLIACLLYLACYLFRTTINHLDNRQIQKQEWNTETWQQLVENEYKPFEKDGYIVTYNQYQDDFELSKIIY